MVALLTLIGQPVIASLYMIPIHRGGLCEPHPKRVVIHAYRVCFAFLVSLFILVSPADVNVFLLFPLSSLSVISEQIGWVCSAYFMCHSYGWNLSNYMLNGLGFIMSNYRLHPGWAVLPLRCLEYHHSSMM